MVPEHDEIVPVESMHVEGVERYPLVGVKTHRDAMVAAFKEHGGEIVRFVNERK